MSEHDDDARYAESKRLLAEAERKLAYTTGQVHARFDALAEDPEHVELMRAWAWAKTGMKFSARGDKIVGVPDGWPEGVDPAEFVGANLSRRKAKFEQPAALEPEDTTSPAVKKFREMLG